jgi:hypothetical protein
VQPFGTIPEVLRADPRDSTVRSRLKKTVIQADAKATLRLAALHALELAPPKQDVLQVALVLAALPASTDDLAENGVAALSRLDLPGARAALDQLPSPSLQADAATALAAKGKER